MLTLPLKKERLFIQDGCSETDLATEWAKATIMGYVYIELTHFMGALKELDKNH